MTNLRLFLFAIALAGCTPAAVAPPNVLLISPDGERIGLTVEIADEPAEQERGLMGRTDLPNGTGMLFVFPRPRPAAFWMKNTVIPLDIFFFDAQGTLLASHTMTPCTADPCPTYPSGGLATYALEVAAGFRERHGVGEGWRMEWIRGSSSP